MGCFPRRRTGVDCPICHQINICENLLKSAYSAITEKAYAGRGMRGHMLFVMMEI